MARFKCRFFTRRTATMVSIALLALTISAVAPTRSLAAQTAGVNAHLLWGGVSAQDMDRELGRLAAAGVGIARVDVGWSSLQEQSKDRYESWYLNRIDALVTQAEAHGVQLLFTLTDSPCWASSAPDQVRQGCEGSWWDRDVQRYAPRDASDYGDALAFLVKRYRGRVAAWEIWNEPNSQSFLKADDQASAYANIVKAAYPAAKAADPNATVLAGSLAEADYRFTDALMRRGIGGSFDAFSIHPYAGDTAPTDPLSDKWIKNSFVRGVPAVRETLLDHGVDKPIWLTEFGWSTSSIRGEQSWRNGVGESDQARYTEEAFEIMRSWDYVPVGILYELQDTRNEPSDPQSNFGLLRHDGSSKPAFAALSRAARGLSRPVPAGSGKGAEKESAEPGQRSLALRVARVDWQALKIRLLRERFRGAPAARAAATRRVRKRASRLGKGASRFRLIARGRGEAGKRVQVRAYRYLAKRGRFSKRAGVSVRFRVNKSGRFSRRLPQRVANGRWRITAGYVDRRAAVAPLS